MDNRSRYQNRIRCIAIGKDLCDGPRALFPPKAVDDYGWLEQDVRITLSSATRVRSIIVFSDDSMNRDDGFLPPMLRYCEWDRSADQPGLKDWPTVSIRLGRVRESPAVDKVIREVQASVRTLEFVPTGLCLNRDGTNPDWDTEHPDYSIFLRNDRQYVECFSLSVKNDLLKLRMNDFFESLLAELVDIDRSGWRERYKQNIKENYPLKSWDWDYEA